MIRYNELLERKLKELRTDVKTFFRIAYCYKFGCDASLDQDVEDYKKGGVPPVYVRNYLDLEATCK